MSGELPSSVVAKILVDFRFNNKLVILTLFSITATSSGEMPYDPREMEYIQKRLDMRKRIDCSNSLIDLLPGITEMLTAFASAPFLRSRSTSASLCVMLAKSRAELP